MFSYGLSPVAEETRKIRRAANCIGAAYAFMFIFDWVLEFFIERSYSFSYFIYIVLSDPIYSELFQISFSCLVFLFPFALCVYLGGKTLSIVEFKRPIKGRALPLILIGVGICQIGEIATNMFGSVLDSFGNAPVMYESEYGTGFYGVALAVLSTAVVPALVEEFAMRGVVLGLLRRFGEGFAIIISSVVFGLMHGNLVQAPFAFIVGVGLGFVAVKGGSVWLSVLVHFVNNLFAVGFYYLSQSLTTTMESAFYCAYAALVLAVGIIGFCICRQKGEIFSFERAKTECSFLKKTAIFFSSPLMVAALVLTAAEIFKIQVF